jgi:hypothetical protein
MVKNKNERRVGRVRVQGEVADAKGVSVLQAEKKVDLAVVVFITESKNDFSN